MPNTPGNRPAGRQRTDGGAGKSVSTHGSGLGTGPVGRGDAYAGRNGGQGPGGPAGGGSGGSGNRQTRGGSGKGFLFLIVIAVIIGLIFGGKGLSGMLGGTQAPSAPQSASLIPGLSGSFQGNGSYSSGWTGENNTGKLDTAQSSAARAKHTTILGGGRDKVTIMVYICGTDLESKSGMASNDLREMASASFSDNINLIVCTGGCRQWKTQSISNSVNQIYRVADGKLHPLVRDFGSKSMTAAETLTSFINYCAKNYPANRNELILWDHGGGTISGFGYDEKNPSSGSMTLANIAKALKAGGQTFDFIGFDACLMATVETALVLDPYADYLIASEETEPGIGWYYTNWLSTFSKNTSIPTVELGKAIVDDFVSVCAQRCPGQKATLSVIDLAELSQTVGGKLSDFSSATAEKISDDYKEVSQARANTKEFGASSKLDQIDLVHFALNMGTDEGKALADTLLSAIKYNKTASNITNAYGLSSYFPYRSSQKVKSAVSQLDAMGFDSEYTDCVKKFASLEVVGQTAAGGSQSSTPFAPIFGIPAPSSQGSAQGQSADITELLGLLFGGSVQLPDRSITREDAVALVDETMLSDDVLVWTQKDGNQVLSLSEDDWSKVSDIQLNVFLDDGRGYIDLGMDNIFYWTEDGDLAGTYDGKWVALNSQPVAYYFTDQLETDGKTVTTGRVPVLLNGDRAELLITFSGNSAEVSGVRFIYADGETDTVAKADAQLQKGDVIQPICDRYSYDGKYEDSYMLGDEIVYDGSITVSDVSLNPDDGDAVATYVLTDLYCQEHWLAPIKD